MRKIYGVDFSGAKDAGSRAWITGGKIEHDLLRIDICEPIRNLPGSSKVRDQALSALCQFILESKDGIFGMDFPLGIPSQVTEHKFWPDMIRSFTADYANAEMFRSMCFENSGRQECRRKTDLESETPFSPYNLRMFRQTYYGIRDVVLPLLDTGAIFLPMQSPKPGVPWIIEICPASTLKSHQIYSLPYKGRSQIAEANRQKILNALHGVAASQLTFDQQKRIIENRGGDALDSLIAALATFNAHRNKVFQKVPEQPYAFEGHVYL